MSLKEIENVEIEFLSEISIPDEFAKVKVKTLKLSGKINDTEIARIIKMFPDSKITINRKLVNGTEILKETFWKIE